MPFPFDLLFWNADSTRLPAANHAFYLREFYHLNRLSKGEMQLGGVQLDLGRVNIPIYELATKEDHIAPARSVFIGSKLFGGPVRFVMAGSGHIAAINCRKKHGHWSGGRLRLLTIDGRRRTQVGGGLGGVVSGLFGRQSPARDPAGPLPIVECARKLGARTTITVR